MRRFLGLLLGSLFVLHTLSTPARAADQIGIRVAPAEIATTVTAGDAVEVPVQVTNTTNTLATFTMVLTDYTVDTAANAITFATLGSQPDSIAPFGSVSSTRVDIEPDRTITVRIRLAPGKLQTADRYRGALVIGPEATTVPSTDAEAIVGVNGKVASLIGVTVAPPAQATPTEFFQQQLEKLWRTPWVIGSGITLALIGLMGGFVWVRRRKQRQQLQNWL